MKNTKLIKIEVKKNYIGASLTVPKEAWLFSIYRNDKEGLLKESFFIDLDANTIEKKVWDGKNFVKEEMMVQA
jgi:hypothetical protein